MRQPIIERRTPAKYNGMHPEGLGFEEDFENFSEQEKLELVYYLERDTFRYAITVGLAIGAGMGIIIGMAFVYIF